MKWAYDLCGAEPIIMDLVAYDTVGSNTIKQGAMVMVGLGGFSAGTTGCGRAVANAYSTTVASAHARNAIGISLETKTTADTPSIATAVNTTAAVAWTKCIVNPFAVYRAAYGTAEQKVITSCATTHLVATTGIAANSADGFYVYFSATAGPNFGHLGICMLSAAGDTFDLDVALTNTATTADKVMFIAPQYGGNNRCGMPLTPDSTGVGIISAGTACPGAVLHLGVVDTIVDTDRGLQRMNYSYTPPTVSNYNMSIQFVKAHPQLLGDGIKKGINKPAIFYNDICIRNHVWGATAI